MVSSMKRVLTALVVLVVTVVGVPSASAYPAPGRVTGDIGVHDPSVVKRTDGSCFLSQIIAAVSTGT